MSIHLNIRPVFTPPFAVTEVMQRMRNCTLPLKNDSWRDNYQVDQSQPFEGVVEDYSFAIARIEVSKVRRAAPPKIKGYVRPLPGSKGSQVRLRYYNSGTIWLIGSFCATALGLSITGIVLEWQRMKAIDLFAFGYFISPLCAGAVQYIQLRAEIGRIQPLLTQLLSLQETSA